MDIMLASLAFLISALCAGIMGFAIQRGATCTVAAMNEVVNKRKFNRLISMVEASVWVAGGLLLAQSFHLLGKMPSGYPLNALTVLGGVLLGLGAYVNGACVFGAVARFGCGDWAYAITPVGFYAGCVGVSTWFAMPAPQKLPYGSFVLRAPEWLALLFVAFALWRLGRPFFTRDGAMQRFHQWVASRVWSPHAATTVIGVTFFFMLLLVGAWAYTDVLTELARKGMAGSLFPRFLLLLALFLGAMVGGWTAGLFCWTPVTFRRLAKCFTGGAMMGVGSLLIPGGNDGLILVGMPLLWPYAWVAFITMCVSIGAAMLAQKSLSAPVAAQQSRKDAA